MYHDYTIVECEVYRRFKVWNQKKLKKNTLTQNNNNNNNSNKTPPKIKQANEHAK